MEENLKPKVLLVHNHYQIPGGEDTVVENEKKMLEDNGHQVIVYSRSNLEINRMNFIQKIFLPLTSVFSINTYREVKRIIRQEKIEIVHVHNTLSLVSPSVYYAAIHSHLPVVQTIHNFRLLCPAGTFYREGHICEDCVAYGLMRALKHKCYRNSRIQTLVSLFVLLVHRLIGTYGKINYICLTQFNKEKLIQINNGNNKYIDEKKIFIKPNFSEKPKDEPKKISLDYYLYIGRIEKLKGIPMLVKAFESLQDDKLLLAGQGELYGHYKKNDEYYQSNQIHFLGQKNKAEIEKLIRGAKAVILPTCCYEGFPMVISESFSLGTPVICSDIGNCSSLIEDRKTGIKFKMNSEEDLCRAVKLFNEMDREIISNNVKYKYYECYSREANYKILLSIYKKIYLYV